MKYLPEEVQYVLKKLNKEGYQVYLVGGCVRDILLCKQPKDYDICTSALPSEVEQIFNKTILTGLKHGTVTVLVGKLPIEISTMRKTSKDKKLLFTDSLEEDVKSRDFTINTLAFDSEFNIYDFVNGVEDLNKKIIRAVGNPDDRFMEDPLRMLRSKRLACQMGFKIEGKTEKSIILNRELIKRVSVERIRDELCKIIMSSKPSEGIEWLYKTGLLKYIIPELCECYGFNQHNIHHNKVVFEHIMMVLDNTPARLNVRLGALLHDIAKPRCFTLDEKGQGHFYKHQNVGAEMAEDILRRLRFDNKTIDSVKKLVRFHMRGYKDSKKHTIKKFINKVGIENLKDLFDLQIADRRGSIEPYSVEDIQNLEKKVDKIIKNKEPLSIKDLDVNGNELANIGVPKTRVMGEILEELVQIVIDNPENNQKRVLLKEAEIIFKRT